MIVAGCDPALGGGHAIVVCDLGEKLILLDAHATYGLGQTEQQLAIFEQTAQKFSPSKVILEYDAQQKGLGNDERFRAMAERYGFDIYPHITRGEKADPIFGVASMDQSFRKGEIRIPYGDEETERRMAALLSQLRAWRPDVPTKRLTQDLVMALWFCWRYWRKIRRVHERKPPVPQSRPSWVSSDLSARHAFARTG